MKLKIYKNYIIKSYLYYFLIVTLIFFLLSFFLNILEEIVFFEKYEVGIYYPILLTFLNTPSILFEIFPFIFLIASQLFFIKFKDNEELDLLKITGIDNFSLIRLLVYLSLVMGIIITVFFYTFSSNLKHNYLLIKNKFTDDNKYLAAINDNGLWIKDEYDDNIYVINADEFTNNILKNVTINQLDEEFNLISIIISEEANINLVFIDSKSDVVNLKDIKKAIFIRSKQDISKKNYKDKGFFNISSKTNYGVEKILILILSKIRQNQEVSRRRDLSKFCRKFDKIRM